MNSAEARELTVRLLAATLSVPTQTTRPGGEPMSGVTDVRLTLFRVIRFRGVSVKRGSRFAQEEI